MNKHENLEIIKMIKKRLKTPKEAYINSETAMKRLNLSLNTKEIKCTKKN